MHAALDGATDLRELGSRAALGCKDAPHARHYALKWTVTPQQVPVCLEKQFHCASGRGVNCAVDGTAIRPACC